MSTCSPDSIVELRDRLLKEARNERQRYLAAAEDAEHRLQRHRVAEDNGHLFLRHRAAEVAQQRLDQQRADVRSITTQTENALAPAHCQTPGGGGGWDKDDEKAQADAIRALTQLQTKGSESKEQQSLVDQLKRDLETERRWRQDLAAQVAGERSRRDAAQQQVLALEFELDSKEAAFQVAERALARREQDLKQVNQQLTAMQGGAAGGLFGQESYVRTLTTQLLERERQLENKDEHIQRLLLVLQLGSPRGLDDGTSTSCPSERSLAFSSAFSKTSSRS